MKRIKSLDKYVFNKLDIPFNSDDFEYNISETKFVDSITEHRKKYLMRNLTIDYYEKNINREEYLREKDVLENMLITTDGFKVQKYVMETITIPIHKKPFKVNSNSNLSFSLIEKELFHITKNHFRGIVEKYESECVSNISDLYYFDNHEVLVHNFNFDTSLGIRHDLLPHNTFIVLESMGNMLFDYNIISYDNQMFNEKIIEFYYYMNIVPKDKYLYYLTEELEQSIKIHR